MSGHSKWHNIRLKKGKVDAERGAKFTKLVREIIVAAKMGGGSPDTNMRLRMAVQKAKENSLPADKIKNAIARGTGEVDGANYDEITYEGYGPAGVAIMVDCATDNRNRTVADLRSIFTRNGGNLGESGSVAYLFNPPQGFIAVERSATDEDTLITLALEAGAEDVSTHDEYFEVITAPNELGNVQAAIEAAGIKTVDAEVRMIPTISVSVAGKEAEQLLKLMDKLEDHDDVQNVTANFELSDEVLAALSR